MIQRVEEDEEDDNDAEDEDDEDEEDDDGAGDDNARQKGQASKDERHKGRKRPATKRPASIDLPGCALVGIPEGWKKLPFERSRSQSYHMFQYPAGKRFGSMKEVERALL